MSSDQIAAHRENAEIYGETICRQKALELLEKNNIPKGMLPLHEMTEVGYNKGSGFIWIKQKNSKTHLFRALNRSVWYDTVITAFIEDRRMKRLTGVKSKEFMIWFTACDISIQDPSSGKLTIGTTAGVSRTFPVSAFEEE
ncbi:hypothetical protein DH2020_032716 [Rehmannia glutinosa]|uniref:Uncharacterized protein n=1 Tax=Rehmannia glutinosa TaxID=99300 RepID=A0ABR0VHW0_REHGL